MSSAVRCDWCETFAQADDWDAEGALPKTWVFVTKSSRTTKKHHWCGECDPRKELAVKEVEGE